MSFKEGVLFTNNKLNNELLFMTGRSFTSSDKCLSSFKVFKMRLSKQKIFKYKDILKKKCQVLNDFS